MAEGNDTNVKQCYANHFNNANLAAVQASFEKEMGKVNHAAMGIEDDAVWVRFNLGTESFVMTDFNRNGRPDLLERRTSPATHHVAPSGKSREDKLAEPSLLSDTFISPRGFDDEESTRRFVEKYPKQIPSSLPATHVTNVTTGASVELQVPSKGRNAEAVNWGKKYFGQVYAGCQWSVGQGK